MCGECVECWRTRADTRGHSTRNRGPLPDARGALADTRGKTPCAPLCGDRGHCPRHCWNSSGALCRAPIYGCCSLWHAAGAVVVFWVGSCSAAPSDLFGPSSWPSPAASTSRPNPRDGAVLHAKLTGAVFRFCTTEGGQDFTLLTVSAGADTCCHSHVSTRPWGRRGQSIRINLRHVCTHTPQQKAPTPPTAGDDSA